MVVESAASGSGLCLVVVRVMDGEPTAIPTAAETDVSLAARIRAGDLSAEEELVKIYRRAVLQIAACRTREPETARDLTQDVLMAVLQALRGGQLREASKLAAFIQGTARNLINSYLRERARRPEVELTVAETQDTDPTADLEFEERRRLVQRELDSFSIIDQQIVLLSLLDGHSLAEVARRLNMSYEAVRARKSRAIRKIIKKFSRLSQK